MFRDPIDYPSTDYLENDGECSKCKYFEPLKETAEGWWGLCDARNYERTELILEISSCSVGIEK